MKNRYFFLVIGVLFFLSACGNSQTAGTGATGGPDTTSLVTGKSKKRLAFKASLICFSDTDFCSSEENWCTASCITKIMDCHQKDSNILNQWINDYAKGVPPKVVPVSDLSTTIGTACSGALTFKAYDDNTTNQDITYDISDTSIVVQYSPALFRGVIDSKKPDAFHFYKALHTVDGQQKIDIVFKAVKNILGVETTVYAGDVSDAIP